MKNYADRNKKDQDKKSERLFKSSSGTLCHHAHTHQLFYRCNDPENALKQILLSDIFDIIDHPVFLRRLTFFAAIRTVLRLKRIEAGTATGALDLRDGEVRRERNIGPSCCRDLIDLTSYFQPVTQVPRSIHKHIACDIDAVIFHFDLLTGHPSVEGTVDHIIEICPYLLHRIKR